MTARRGAVADPGQGGGRVKTDHRDALMLAKLHRAGELTAIWIPDAAHEAMRDLVRARATAGRVLAKARQHLQGFLLRAPGAQATAQSGSVDQVYCPARRVLGSTPASTIEDHYGMGIGRNLTADLAQMMIRREPIADQHSQRCCLAFRRAHGTKHTGRGEAEIHAIP